MLNVIDAHFGVILSIFTFFRIFGIAIILNFDIRDFYINNIRRILAKGKPEFGKSTIGKMEFGNLAFGKWNFMIGDI